MKLPNVQEAMSKDVITCQVDCTIQQIANLMTEKNIRSIIIENKIGKPIGLVTGGDIVNAVSKKLAPETQVKELVGKELINIDFTADIIEAAKLMNEKNIKRLAVNEKGVLVGIITVHDVLKYSPQYLTEFSRTLDKLDSIIKKL